MGGGRIFETTWTTRITRYQTDHFICGDRIIWRNFILKYKEDYTALWDVCSSKESLFVI